MKFLIGLLNLGLVTFGIMGGGMAIDAHAQNTVSYNQVMSSLATGKNTAKRIGFDTEALHREIEAKIVRENTANAQTPSTALDVLRTLPQLIVQIQFDFDSDSIRPQSWVTIGRIADALHHPLLAGNRFLIVGHTDAKGKRLYNFELSQRRALSVSDMLISTFRINPTRLLPMGLGEEQLFNSAKPNDGVNRRVEFFNMGPT